MNQQEFFYFCRFVLLYASHLHWWPLNPNFFWPLVDESWGLEQLWWSPSGREIIESNENRLELSITVVVQLTKPSESGSCSTTSQLIIMHEETTLVSTSFKSTTCCTLFYKIPVQKSLKEVHKGFSSFQWALTQFCIENQTFKLNIH